MDSYKFFFVLVSFIFAYANASTDIIELKCNLNSAEKNSAICNLKSNLTKYGLDGKRFVPVYKTITEGSESSSILPSVVELDGLSGSLNWLNKYQPVSTRWSQLCSAPGQQQLYPTVNSYYCLNHQTCDSTGTCTIKFKSDENKMVLIHLNDNLNDTETEAPSFPSDLQLINISLDSNMLDYGSDGQQDTELVLIESTVRLNSLTSKPNRLLNEFELNAIESDRENEELLKKHCGSQSVSSRMDKNESPFSVRLESANEKLYLKFKNNNANRELFKKKTCFVYSLSVRRPITNGQASLALVVINVADNKIDQPVFDFSVYNFTIVENSTFNTMIGQVRAIYSNHVGDQETLDNLINYRIVTFFA